MKPSVAHQQPHRQLQLFELCSSCGSTWCLPGFLICVECSKALVNEEEEYGAGEDRP